MKSQVILICLIMTVIAQGQSEPSRRETGTVCVSTVPRTNSQAVSLGNPDGGNRSFDYTIQIGSQKVVASTERSVAIKGIKGLSLNKTHIVRILREVLLRSFPDLPLSTRRP